jgi:hypothetical protein
LLAGIDAYDAYDWTAIAGAESAPEHGKDIVSHKLLSEVINVDLLHTKLLSPFASRL